MKNNIINVFMETVAIEERPEFEAFFETLNEKERAFIIEYMEGLEFDNILDQLTLDELMDCRDVVNAE